MRMHKAAGPLALVAVGAIVVASAMAQDAPANRDQAKARFSATVKATPSKAGTRQHPQGVTISATGKIATGRGVDPPILTGIDLFLGRGIAWNGGEYATCSKAVLDRKGPEGCPRGSIVGGLTASARAGAIATRPQVTFVAGGAKRIYAYTRFDYPARVRETIVIKTTAANRRYTGKLRVPKHLQVVAGIPIQTTRMKLTIGGRPYAQDYIATTSCPQGGWKFKATVHLRYDPTGQTDRDTVSGSIPCTS